MQYSFGPSVRLGSGDRDRPPPALEPDLGKFGSPTQELHLRRS